MREIYTHGHHDSVVRSHGHRTVTNSAGYLLPHLRPGMNVLDVGCGPGSITLDLAELVAPGHVMGVDSAPEAIRRARQLAHDRGDTRTSFATRSVYQLASSWPAGPTPTDPEARPDQPLAPPSQVDVVHAHQVLQHLADPVAALVEMRHVCRPGGLVAVRDADYAAMTWYPQVPGLDRWLALYRAVATDNGGEPDAGRRLLSWAQAAGFERIEPSASTWCYATPSQRQTWAEDWVERAQHSAFAEHALRLNLATRADLADIAQAWRDWAACRDGWFAILHGEILAWA